MTKIPQRIQMSRQRKWKPEGAKVLICDRRSKWGNHFGVDNVELSLEGYETEIRFGVGLQVLALEELLDYDYLACWCPLDKKCHVDILIKLLKELCEKKHD